MRKEDWLIVNTQTGYLSDNPDNRAAKAHVMSSERMATFHFLVSSPTTAFPKTNKTNVLARRQCTGNTIRKVRGNFVEVIFISLVNMRVTYNKALGS